MRLLVAYGHGDAARPARLCRIVPTVVDRNRHGYWPSLGHVRFVCLHVARGHEERGQPGVYTHGAGLSRARAVIVAWQVGVIGPDCLRTFATGLQDDHSLGLKGAAAVGVAIYQLGLVVEVLL